MLHIKIRLTRPRKTGHRMTEACGGFELFEPTSVVETNEILFSPLGAGRSSAQLKLKASIFPLSFPSYSGAWFVCLLCLTFCTLHLKLHCKNGYGKLEPRDTLGNMTSFGYQSLHVQRIGFIVRIHRSRHHGADQFGDCNPERLPLMPTMPLLH